MRRIISVTLILILPFVVFCADGEETLNLNRYEYATISFTALVHSIFGFSDSPVDGPIRPATKDPVIEFEYKEGDSTFETKVFHVYYQIFTDKAIEVYLSVIPDSGNTIKWSDVYGLLTTDGTSGFNSESKNVLINTDSGKKIGSVPLMLRIDNDSLESIDWNAQYRWKLKLTIGSQE